MCTCVWTALQALSWISTGSHQRAGRITIVSDTLKKNKPQKNNNIDRERHRETTGTNTQTNTHCLGAAGRPGSQHSAGQSQSCSRKWLPLLHHLCMGSSPCKAGAGREHTELGCYVTYCFHVTRKTGSMFQLTWTLFECKGNESCIVSF